MSQPTKLYMMNEKNSIVNNIGPRMEVQRLMKLIEHNQYV